MSVEDIKTTFGIDSASAVTLWKIIKDDIKLKRRIFSVLNDTIHYYISAKSIKNVACRKYILRLIHEEAKRVAEKLPVLDARTYFKNVLTILYRENLLLVQELN